MSKAAHELYNAFKKAFGPGTDVFPAIVTAVNADGSLKVDVDGVEYPDVLVQASLSDGQKGEKVRPAVDSLIIIERIGDAKSNEFMAVLFSEIEQHTIEIGTASWDMTGAGFDLKKDDTVLNIGEDGFLVKKDDDTLKEVLTLIVQAVMKIIVLQGTNPDRAKLQQALTKINNLFQ
jgi:hypothetical protein